MTTHRNSGGNGKHNTHNNNNNNNNMEELIESKLSHKLAQLQAQGLIGPSLRGKKILDDKGQERLENLEKKVMVLAMTAAEQTINNCFPEDNEGDEEEEGVQQDGGAASGAGGSGSSGGAIKPSSASSKRKESYSSGLKVGMTPLTSAQAAKSYIKKAKKRQMEGQLKEALKLYMNGKLLFPPAPSLLRLIHIWYLAQKLIDNPRLKKKIKQLQDQTRYEPEDEDEEEEEDRITQKDEEDDEDEDEESDVQMVEFSKKRKSETDRERAAYEANKKRKMEVDDDEEDDEEDEEEKAAKCIIKRRPRHEDDEDEEDEEAEQSDDDFVPEEEQKKTKKGIANNSSNKAKAAQVFSFASPAKEAVSLLPFLFLSSFFFLSFSFSFLFLIITFITLLVGGQSQDIGSHQQGLPEGAKSFARHRTKACRVDPQL